jgi:hypothetical protein
MQHHCGKARAEPQKNSAATEQGDNHVVAPPEGRRFFTHGFVLARHWPESGSILRSDRKACPADVSYPSERAHGVKLCRCKN